MRIKRFHCINCKKTHAILPTLLFGQVRHTKETIEPYAEQFIKKQASTNQLWADSFNLPDAPQDISTLYRWFNRFIARCKSLLPLLKNELLQLAPQSNLKEFENILLKQEMLSPHAVCKSTILISEKLLTETTQLLQIKNSLTPFAFLNYFCWQQTGKALLAPLPPKPQ